MYSKIRLSLSTVCVVFISGVLIQPTNGQTINDDSSKMVVFQVDSTFPQCANSLTYQIKEQCLQHNCLGQPFLFECQALKCKAQFPGTELIDKAKRLRCIKRKCVLHQSHAVCQQMRVCDAMKELPLGKARFIVCITKLFPQDNNLKEEVATTTAESM